MKAAWSRQWKFYWSSLFKQKGKTIVSSRSFQEAIYVNGAGRVWSLSHLGRIIFLLFRVLFNSKENGLIKYHTRSATCDDLEFYWILFYARCASMSDWDSLSFRLWTWHPQQATTGKHARVSGKKRDKQIEKYSFHTAINSLEIINKFIHILAILLRVSLAVSKNQLSWGD